MATARGRERRQHCCRHGDKAASGATAGDSQLRRHGRTQRRSGSDGSEEPAVAQFEVSSLKVVNQLEMGHGVSAGGGQSSLAVEKPPLPTISKEQAVNVSLQMVDMLLLMRMLHHHQSRNKFGQNSRDSYQQLPSANRPSTKVHAAPGGGSSLGYLFGGPPPNGN